MACAISAQGRLSAAPQDDNFEDKCVHLGVTVVI